MDDWIEINRDERHIKRERAKARELRNTPYYQELFRKGICHYCGKKFPAAELTLDHIVPVARGGKSTRGNLVVCCLGCNQAKKYLTPAEMLLRQMEREEQNGSPEEKRSPGTAWLPGDAQTFFFDFDGTLCASEPDIRNAWRETLQELHLECPLFDRIFRTGPMVQQMAQMLFPDFDEDRRDLIVAEFKRRYDRSDFPRTFPYPGVDRWLRSLHQTGHTLCLVTNRRELATQTILKKLDWTSLFAGYFCSDRGGKLTAKPELLRLALQQAEFSRRPAIMIGDTAHDVETGRVNGILTAGVLWGYGRPGELEAACPDYLLSLRDISETL